KPAGASPRGFESHPLRNRKAPCRTHGDLRRRSRTWVRLGESAANGEQRGCAGGAPELNPTPSVVERHPVEPTAIFEEDRERGFGPSGTEAEPRMRSACRPATRRRGAPPIPPPP